MSLHVSISTNIPHFLLVVLKLESAEKALAARGAAEEQYKEAEEKIKELELSSQVR